MKEYALEIFYKGLVLHTKPQEYIQTPPQRKIKGRDKVITVHAMKAYRWGGGTDPIILEPGTRR
jgi:hypothetical protein